MISNDEKDVYETEDLPESEQSIDTTANDGIIETITISPESAKNQFKNKMVITSITDFSDCIKSRFNLGYAIDTSEYVLIPENERQTETPLQKFQRLQNEVRELHSEIDYVKQISKLKVDSIESGVNFIEMEKKIEKFIKQMSIHEMYNKLGSSEAEQLELDEDLCGLETREMFEDIRQYMSKHKNDSNFDKLTWEKYYRSSLPKEMEYAKITNLDQRLLKLEAALGNADLSANLSGLTVCLSSKGLVDTTKMLTSRCQALKGAPNVEKIEGRLVNLQTKLQAITEKWEVIKEADRQNKIAELYDLVDKWQTLQPDADFIFKRLSNLQDLHKQALLFTETLSQVDLSQKDIKKDYIQYSDNLKEIQNDFVAKVTKIESNVASLQSKMENL